MSRTGVGGPVHEAAVPEPDSGTVPDGSGSGPAVNGELNVALDEADFMIVFPMDADRRARLVGVVSDERAERAESLTFEDVFRTVIDALKLLLAAAAFPAAWWVVGRRAGEG